MKHVITIKQKNLMTLEENLLCDEVCEIIQGGSGIEFEYHEKKPLNGKVKMSVTSKECLIQRIAESQSKLHLMEKKKTQGVVKSIYGEFEIELYTHIFHYNDKIIAIEYDVLNDSQVIERYRLMVKIKKMV